MHKGNIDSRPSFRLIKCSPDLHGISTPWQEGLNLPLDDLRITFHKVAFVHFL